MGERLRGLIVLGVVLAAGIFIGSAVSQWNPLPQQEIVAPPPGNSTATGLGRVRVEVLNAGGREDMARLATDHLRDRGFDVVYFGMLKRSGRTPLSYSTGREGRERRRLSGKRSVRPGWRASRMRTFTLMSPYCWVVDGFPT